MNINDSWDEIFRSLWDTWNAPVYKYCLFKLNGDAARADDCMQNTFITLFEAKDRIDDLEHIHAWLFRVANNYILKEFRRMKREKEFLELEDAENHPALTVEAPDAEQLNDAQIDGLRERLVSMLNREEATLLEYAFEKNMPIKDIASKLGLTESAVYKRRSALVTKIKLIASGFFE